MTTDDITTGISCRLDALYPASHIYTDKNVEQGLETPAFYIKSPSGSIGPGYMQGRKVHRLFIIEYYPESEGSRDECASVADILMIELALITLPDGHKIRGTDIDYTVQDGVLHMTVGYDCMVAYTQDTEAMETLDTSIGTKGA
ncbi:MAG: hypothetical protein LBJ91_02625 [Clostridiales Family XIII bacterium]|jgi:hypothetical protein|nr:hypothetical protein [Clostridiales Family XIII bacterium]